MLNTLSISGFFQIFTYTIHKSCIKTILVKLSASSTRKRSSGYKKKLFICILKKKKNILYSLAVFFLTVGIIDINIIISMNAITIAGIPYTWYNVYFPT